MQIKEKIGVLVPTRGDRPEFRRHAEYLIGRQTLRPHVVHFVDTPPQSNDKDIAWRYKNGIRKLRSECDLIFLFEDDDWYGAHYIMRMYEAWGANGRPNIFGICATFYYHLKTLKFTHLIHPNHSSAMCTVVTKNIIFDHIPDNEVFFDIKLWSHNKGVLVDFRQPLCVGIKHGMGLCGGMGHREDLKNYNNHDAHMVWLGTTVDETSFKFYKSIHENLTHPPITG